MSILLPIALALYVLVGILMVLVILMQRPKSEGLGAAFGGGVTENIFGAQTTNVLTKITGWMAGIFFVLAFVLSVLYANRTNTGSAVRRQLMKDQPLPAATAVPVPGISPGTAPGVPAPAETGSPAPAAPAESPAPVEPNTAAQASPQPAVPAPAAPESSPQASP